MLPLLYEDAAPDVGQSSHEKGQSMGNSLRPVASIRHDKLQAAIWRNQNENGVYHCVTLGRAYKDGNGEWHSTDSFGRDDLLLLAKIVNEAHSEILKLQKAEPQQQAAKPQAKEAATANGGRNGR